MRVRALDNTGDWTYGKGQNDYLTSNAAAAQMINTRLLAVLGDCFFDSESGIPWFTYIGGKDEVALTLAISTTILNTPDENGNLIVTGINQLSVNLDENTRAFTIKYQVVTTFSVVTSAFVYDYNAASGG